MSACVQRNILRSILRAAISALRINCENLAELCPQKCFTQCISRKVFVLAKELLQEGIIFLVEAKQKSLAAWIFKHLCHQMALQPAL